MLSRFEKFTYDINEIDLHWHRIASAEMKGFGLKGGTTIYFTKLYTHPEGLTAAELGAVCGRDKADVSRDAAQLEKAGLITRGKGYRARITLTEQGKELTKVIIQKAEAAVRIVGSALTDVEREVFYIALDKITANLQALSETGLPDEAKGEK